MRFTAMDLGPAESPHDSLWALGEDTAHLSSSAIRSTTTCTPTWRTASTPSGCGISTACATCPPTPSSTSATERQPRPGLLDWQRGYIETFLAAINAADFSDPAGARAEVVARVKDYLPSDDLQFLMELSIEPVGSSGVLER